MTHSDRARSLAIGTAQFGADYGVANTGGMVSLDEARRILDLGARRGIDMVDTAVAYGDSQRTLGDLGVETWRVVSKLPPLPDEVQDSERVESWVWNTVEASLGELGKDSLYGLLLHRPEDLLGERGPALLSGLLRVRAMGRVTKVGYSIYHPSQLDALVDVQLPDLVQAPISVLDRRMVESGWVAKLADAGVELHARSVFLQGLVLMNDASRPPYFQRWSDLWSAWQAWISATGGDALAAALHYVLSLDHVARVVVGVESAVQLGQILDAIEGDGLIAPDDLCTDDLDLLSPQRWPRI